MVVAPTERQIGIYTLCDLTLKKIPDKLPYRGGALALTIACTASLLWTVKNGYIKSQVSNDERHDKQGDIESTQD